MDNPTDLIRLYAVEAKPAREVASILGTSDDQVRKALTYHGIPTRGHGGKREEDLAAVLTKEFLTEQLITKNRSIRDVALELNTSNSVINKRLTELGMPSHKKLRTQQRKRAQKELRDALADLVKLGYSDSQIATRCEVSTSYMATLRSRYDIHR